MKIIHEFDTSKLLPEIDNLLVEFITFLADRKLKESAELEKKNFMKETLKSNNVSSSTVQYIEKLLEIGISDYRKNAVGLILAPYFVNILKLSDEESFNRIKEWILKCNNVKALEPSIKNFDNSIKNAITRAKVIRIKPLKFRETLQYKNKKLYHIILSYLKN